MTAPANSIPAPFCHGMTEHPNAAEERLRISKLPPTNPSHSSCSPPSPLSVHIMHGLAYTVGSALGSTPPSTEACRSAFVYPNKAGLTAGARAWAKHSHRSQGDRGEGESAIEGPGCSINNCYNRKGQPSSTGWWGTPSGPVAHINERALLLFWKIMDRASWRNLHWLPHRVLTYEVRVPEGYGMRWSQDQSTINGEDDDGTTCADRPWIFRGFIEPMMDNGHEVGWRH